MADALKIALILTAVDKASAVFDKSFKKMNAGLKGLDKYKQSLNKYGNQFFVAGAAATAFFTKTILNAEKTDTAIARLRQVYKSMGETTNQAADDAVKLAEKTALQIGVDKEIIMLTEAKLATFKSVSNEAARQAGIFDRATKAAHDMQATGFGDAAMNAVQLGKALEDPVKGLNALRRSGITFNEQEKKNIEVLVKSGKKLEAQGIILKAIEKQVGGVAIATSNASDKMKVAFNEIFSKIGSAILPAFSRYTNKLIDALPKIKAWVAEHGRLIKILTVVSIAVLALGVAMKVIAFGIGGIQAAGAALGAITTFLMANPIVLIIAAIAAAAYLIYDNWAAIKSFFIDLWDGVKQTFFKVWEWIKKLFFKYHPAGIIYKHWDKIVAFFQNLWDKVKQKFWNFIDFVKSLPRYFLDAGKNMISSLWQGIKNEWYSLSSWVSEKADWLYSKFTVNGIVESAFNAAKQKQSAFVYNVNNSMQSSGAGGYGGASSSTSSVYNPVSKSNMTYAPVITLNGAATQADADMVNSTTQKGFDKMMGKYNNQRERTGYN